LESHPNIGEKEALFLYIMFKVKEESLGICIRIEITNPKGEIVLANKQIRPCGFSLPMKL